MQFMPKGSPPGQMPSAQAGPPKVSSQASVIGKLLEDEAATDAPLPEDDSNASKGAGKLAAFSKMPSDPMKPAVANGSGGGEAGGSNMTMGKGGASPPWR